jgi:peptide chain release factor 3
MTSSASPEVLREIAKRRTFAIISHPDAGKTTVTEKLLLFGNAIQMAGVVKAKRAKQFATSDWMEIEKQRGISVTSSVMQFHYDQHEVNLLDTPGHADFSEDTYRVLTAVDSALMVVDAAKGIETQTKKLFQVCRDRHIPITTFINKMDREAKDPFDLIQEIEETLKIDLSIITWPIGMGDRFKGVYDRLNKCLRLFSPGQKTTDFVQEVFTDINDPKLSARIGEEFVAQLKEDLELIEGAGHAFDHARYLKGDLSPVFFGSAINNFGIQELLNSFINYAPGPSPRPAEQRTVQPIEAPFTGIVFKIQANMDSKHRDRFAFVRICSGEFTQGMMVHNVRLDRDIKINHATQFLSKERKNIDKAYAGDIIGVHDKTLMIGDTLTQGEDLKFTGIPQFSPDHFSLVELKNPIKMKQLQKGLEQLAEEGTSQLFRRKFNSDTIMGVVGKLQLEVVKFRLLHEYGAEAIFTMLPYECSRWYRCDKRDILEKFEAFFRDQTVFDVRSYPMILFKSEWEQKYVSEKYPDVKFYSSLIAFELDA